MSLNFQLARGGFALVVLALSAATAWLAPPAGDASSTTHRVVIVADTGAVVVCPLPAPVMRLASAPGDLPTRLATDCRA